LRRVPSPLWLGEGGGGRRGDAGERMHRLAKERRAKGDPLSDNMSAGWKHRNDQTPPAPGGLIGPYLVVIKAPAAAIREPRKRATLCGTHCA